MTRVAAPLQGLRLSMKLAQMPDDPWSPEQYERFRDERQQPFRDLLALVEPAEGMTVLDLGCGTGELTRELHERLRAKKTVGVDSSPQMLAKAQAFSGGGVEFVLGDVRTFQAMHEFDVVFSNAALQWLPDHVALLAQLNAAVAVGGQLAVQVPSNFDHPSHVVAIELAKEEPFRTALGDSHKPPSVLKPEEYAVILDRLGYQRQHVRLQVYGHQLAKRDDVVEWVKGTALTPYRRAFSEEVFAVFLDRYRERLFAVLEDTRPFFYPFKRILFWGRLPGGAGSV
jgi:trans-aconitate 2-methyltransferase